jgi:predicted phage-related endonuclease
MKRKLPIVRIDRELSYNEWLNFRNMGLGGSEIAAVMGMSQFKCSAEVYYQKIGKFDQMRKPNLAMVSGNLREPELFTKYQMWGGSIESFIDNYMESKIVNKLYNPKFFVINPEFPHLFFSPDALMLKDYEHGRKFVVKGNYLYPDHIDKVIEFKTVNGFAFKQWEDEFNPAYGIQLMSYLMGMGIDEGRIFTEIDGRDLKESTIKFDEEIASTILSVTQNFWERVELGREAVAKGGDYEQFAPEPDGSEAYTQFLKEKYKNPEEKIAQDYPVEILQHAGYANWFKLRRDEVEETIAFHENNIKAYMGDRITGINFGDMGKLTWRPNSKGTRSFINRAKPLDPNEEGAD